MFCGCELSFGDEPNVHTCPVCLGHPGTLPATNEQAVLFGLMIAAALGARWPRAPPSTARTTSTPTCRRATRSASTTSRWPRSTEGWETSASTAPIEEDAAKLIHVGSSGRIHGSGSSLVDFNRGGAPLVEIVTEPDIRSAAQAREWAQLLRETLRQLGVSDVNMEEEPAGGRQHLCRPAGARSSESRPSSRT